MIFNATVSFNINDKDLLDTINKYPYEYFDSLEKVPEELIIDAVWDNKNLEDIINYDSMLERIEVRK